MWRQIQKNIYIYKTKIHGKKYRQKAEKEISGSFQFLAAFLLKSSCFSSCVPKRDTNWFLNSLVNELSRVSCSYFQPRILTTITSFRKWASESGSCFIKAPRVCHNPLCRRVQILSHCMKKFSSIIYHQRSTPVWRNWVIFCLWGGEKIDLSWSLAAAGMCDLNTPLQ